MTLPSPVVSRVDAETALVSIQPFCKSGLVPDTGGSESLRRATVTLPPTTRSISDWISNAICNVRLAVLRTIAKGSLHSFRSASRIFPDNDRYT